MSKQKRQPGKKRGRKINNTIALRPLGVKGNRYEIDARMALVALENNVAQESHLVDLYVLADLCERMGATEHISTHAQTTKRICNEIYEADYHCAPLTHAAISSSCGVLLDWFHAQKNSNVINAAMSAIREQEKRAA